MRLLRGWEWLGPIMGMGVGRVLGKSGEMEMAESRWRVSSLLDGKDDHMGGGMVRSNIGMMWMDCR